MEPFQIKVWWRHQMETFSALLAIFAGNSPVPSELPTQRPVKRSFDVFFDLRPNNGWVNNREAGGLRRHRAHYDVNVMGSHFKISTMNPGVFLKYFQTTLVSLRNIFCLTGPLYGEVTGYRWIPLTTASDVELWCFLWSAPEQTFEQTIETPVIWDTIAPIMTSL